MDVEVPLLQTYVDGLDRSLGGGIPKGSTILVAGTPGTMKTSLILWMMHENARLPGARDVPFHRGGEGTRPDDVPHRGDAFRLESSRPVGGRLPRGWHPESQASRGRGDGGPASAALRQDAWDEPRPQRPRAEPRRPEVLRDPRHFEEEVTAA